MNYQHINFNAFINGRWCNLNIHCNQLTMGNTIIKLDRDIIGIAMGKNKFFIVYKEAIYNDSKKLIKQFYNNIYAYDYNGKILYNIGDLIQKKETYVCAFINELDSIIYPNIEPIKGHEYLICSSFSSINYYIDVNEDKYITSVFTK